MSDIVERLRQYVDLNDNRDYSYCDCADEAADEIDRLRQQVIDGCELSSKLGREIERLQELVARQDIQLASQGTTFYGVTRQT